MSKVFSEEKGWSMDKTNRVVYKDVLRLFGGFLFVALIFCNGSSVYAGADDSKASNKINLAWRYVSDGLLFYNELAKEAGSDFVKARKMHADLLGKYVREMEAREADYVTALLTEEAARILENLKSIRKSLKEDVPPDQQNPNAWAKQDVNEASEKLGNLLKDFEPYLKDPFDFDGFEKLGDKCRIDLYAALKKVTVKLREYIEHLTVLKADNPLAIKKAEELCEANREAIVLLFLNRFARFEGQGVNAESSVEGLDLRILRQFRGDINRTIYWNRVLRKRLKGSDESVLKKYSASELRRLRVLRAVLNEDMREAQDLLLIAFRDSFPLKTKTVQEEARDSGAVEKVD